MFLIVLRLLQPMLLRQSCSCGAAAVAGARTPRESRDKSWRDCDGNGDGSNAGGKECRNYRWGS
jgi:hypothetical protein